jgi:predicted ABC-type transport system involved in lysophospholipase L1 biosynthesis ATPase subunit
MPTSGEVLIDGHELSKMDERQRVSLRRARIGFTFQSNNLIPFLNARENVDLMLRLNGLRAETTGEQPAELLSKLGLGDHLQFLPGQMSGGQQQRVAMPGADPQSGTGLADEPTAALDTSGLTR